MIESIKAFIQAYRATLIFISVLSAVVALGSSCYKLYSWGYDKGYAKHQEQSTTEWNKRVTKAETRVGELEQQLRSQAASSEKEISTLAGELESLRKQAPKVKYVTDTGKTISLCSTQDGSAVPSSEIRLDSSFAKQWNNILTKEVTSGTGDKGGN